MTVEHIGSWVVLTLVDEGRGGADPSAGTGLRGLADRIEALGGRMTVSCVVGKGNVVGVDIPLPAVGLSVRRGIAPAAWGCSMT